MKHPSVLFLKANNLLFLRSFIILFLCCVTVKLNVCFSSNSSSLRTLPVDGHFTFDEVHHVAKDFGNRFQLLPLAILHPKSVADIATTIRHIWQMGPHSELTIAARGRGHSLQGQAQAHQGVVVKMESLQGPKMHVHAGSKPYVDVSGGELWINILRETLQHGLAPKSWTDYLHLTVGGTLSNAGISGQAFKHGPQISNVYQLEVVTGKGEVFNCSQKQNVDLFHSVLGGLGQFGIITRARISLEPAPKMVKATIVTTEHFLPNYNSQQDIIAPRFKLLKHLLSQPILRTEQVKWIRVLYSEFSTFTKDQEHLIMAEDTFDYIEGFVIINRTGLLNNWRSSFNPQDPAQASKFKSDGKTLFCIELAKYFNPDRTDIVNKEVMKLLSQLHYIPSTLFQTEVPCIDFLDRVHVSEIKLRSKGLWEVHHPWLNLLVPKSKIHHFAEEVFGKILTDTSNGPILLYPVNKSKWDNRTSAIIPEEDIFYLVAFLSSAVPSSAGTNGLEHILTQNKRILDFCERASLGAKQYLPHHSTQDEWKTHFGPRWEVFVQRKSAYDPLAMLAPGQRIFQKAMPFS